MKYVKMLWKEWIVGSILFYIISLFERKVLHLTGGEYWAVYLFSILFAFVWIFIGASLMYKVEREDENERKV